MKKIVWQDGLQDMIEKLCAIFPAVIKDRWQSRLICSAEKIAAREEAPEVTADIFWRAVYEVFPGGYEPLILSKKDPGRMRAEVAASKAQEDIEPGNEPVCITRWAQKSNQDGPVSPGMKILAVNSSMRKGGNTDVLIDEVSRACHDNGCDVEKLYLGDLAIKPCTGCRACRKGDVKTICSLKDDMTSVVYEKMYAMDGLILGFPIYTARENAIMANFMDRWDCFANPELSRKMPAGKKGLIISTWMWPNPVAYDNVVEQMIILLRLHGVDTTDVLTASGTRGKRHGRGVVKNHPHALATAYTAGVDFLKGLSKA
ncbi:MAG: flavodoxin family protein [Pseudomonadota bacterium]